MVQRRWKLQYRFTYTLSMHLLTRVRAPTSSFAGTAAAASRVKCFTLPYSASTLPVSFFLILSSFLSNSLFLSLPISLSLSVCLSFTLAHSLATNVPFRSKTSHIPPRNSSASCRPTPHTTSVFATRYTLSAKPCGT